MSIALICVLAAAACAVSFLIWGKMPLLPVAILLLCIALIVPK